MLAHQYRHRLISSGIGYVDVHLLAAAQLIAGTTLWTRDKRLRDSALRLGLPASEHRRYYAKTFGNER